MSRITPIVLAALLACVGCQTEKTTATTTAPSSTVEPPKKVYLPGTSGCSEGAFYASLKKVFPLLADISGRDATRADLKKARERIACIRDWLPQVSDPCLRVNYENWLDYYSEAVDKRETALNEPEKPQGEQPWDRQTRIAAEYAANHKVPVPPLCERIREENK